MEDSEIRRLRNMKGRKRLWFKSDFSTWLLSIDYEQFPGLDHEFLEAKRWKTETGEWNEYKLLLRGRKFEDSGHYHSFLFKNLSKFFDTIPEKRFEVNSMGLEEIDCSESDSYYILLYFLTNGNDYIPTEEVLDNEE